MTDRFRRKVRSQRGASLLLALLFLLICAMVGASILMAAASNAGKHRSNLTEHQTYLALSSAVSLLCDELNAAEYRGQYESWKEPVMNDEGEVTGFECYFKQVAGTYTYTDGGGSAAFKDLLLDDFDKVFSSTITLPTDVTNVNGVWGVILPLPSHSITLTPETGILELDRKDVTITLTVKDSYAIYLTAYLEDLEVYQVEAELTPNVSNKPTLPASLPYKGENVIEKTDPMKWKLGWITTGAEEGDDP